MISAPETQAAAAPARTTASNPKRCEQSSNFADRLQAVVSVCKIVENESMLILRNVSIADMLEEIRSGRYSSEIGHYRTLRLRHGNDDPAAKAAKLALHAYLLSGRIEGRVAQAMPERRLHHSGCLQLDFDGIEDAEAFRDELIQDPHVLAAWISPSGEGVKGLAAMQPARTEDAHKAVFCAAENYFAGKGWTIDPACKNTNRLCFVGWDSDLRIREDEPQEFGSMKDWQEYLKLSKKAKKTAKTTTSKATSTGAGIVIRSEAFPEPPRDGIHAWTMTAAWYCRLQGNMTEAEAITKLESYEPSLRRSYQDNEVRDAVTKVYASAMPASIFDIPPATTEKLDLAIYTMTDSGNAERVHAYAGSNFRYVSESGRWLLWDGKRWSPDTNGGMVRLFISVMKLLGKSAFECGDPDRTKSITKHALNSMDSSKVTAGLQMLKSISGVSISVNDLDADHWMIGTTDGMIDLNTGKPITPDRSKLITKIIGTGYDASATCPTWEKFLKTVTNGDTELINFLQCAVGYTLTGSNREQCLFFLHGSGCNGKGVFCETIKKLVGDYGQTAPESLFTIDRNQSSTNHIARLAGCRMAIAAELEEGASFAESRIKGLTGGDTITAKFHFKEWFDFIPTHHLWICGNHKPRITGSDDGIWRRIRLIPFIVRITDEEKDLNLADKLAKELPGILNWALEGCLRWQQEGLKTPSCVSKATEGYRAEEDIIGDFLAECTEERLGEQILISSLYECYQNWAQKGGIKNPLTARTLNKKFDDRGMPRHSSNGGRYWKGIVTI